jgi:hypothetical protein
MIHSLENIFPKNTNLNYYFKADLNFLMFFMFLGNCLFEKTVKKYSILNFFYLITYLPTQISFC